MSSKDQGQQRNRVKPKNRLPKPALEEQEIIAQQRPQPAINVQQVKRDPTWLTQRNVLHLQRMIGNQAVGRLLGQAGRAQEALAGQDEPNQERTTEEPRVTAVQVSAVFRGGSDTPSTRMGGFTPKAEAIVAGEGVAPSGSPTVHAGGGNDCTPGVEALDWNVVEDGANWRANVVALNVSGDLHITEWPNNPTSMTVPNTPNPVDGGNINNTAGSPNQWETVIDDMADYDTAGSGGAGANWHSTAASRAHEWAHWNEDYLGDAIPRADWAGTNRDIDRMTVPKSAHADAAAARTALEPGVTARFSTFVRAVTARWNTLINDKDKPGQGGRGYAAGLRVLNGLIASIRAYAATKGWSGLSTGAKTAIGAGSGALIGGLVGGPLGALLGAGLGGLIGSVF